MAACSRPEVHIGLLLAGATLGGLFHQVVGLGLEESVAVQSVFTALGFAVMTYSLFTAGPPASDRT